MGLSRGTVRLENYNPKWKDMFCEEAANLKKIFGNLAIKIEHIGSTSIENIKSKPIIDIAVGLQKLNDFEQVKTHFEEAPYSVKQNSVEGEILVRKGPEENINYLIHVMEIYGERYKNAIIFRDYLREHKEILKKYEELKEKLAIQYANNRKMYTASKNDFIQMVLKIAKIDI